MRRTLTDANVLYPSILRNLLMHLATGSLCDLRWSEQIHEEWISNLMGNTNLNETALRRTRALMEHALPEARVTDYEHLIPTLNLPDPNDRHVVAAALQGGATEILTFNLRDFPPSTLEPLGLRAIHPDPWLCRHMDEYPEMVGSLVMQMLGSLKNPPMTTSGLCDALTRLNLPEAAQRLETLLQDPEDTA